MEDTKEIESDMAKVSIGLFRNVDPRPIKEVYKITRKIGSGAYGEVRK